MARDHNGMMPTNNGLKTSIKDVDVDGWEHGQVDDPLGYASLRADGPPKVLTEDQIRAYDEDGYVYDEKWGCCAGRVMPEEQALGVGEKIKEMELRLGKGVNGFGPMHLTQRWWHDIVTAPAILDAVEDHDDEHEMESEDPIMKHGLVQKGNQLHQGKLRHVCAVVGDLHQASFCLS